MQYFTEKKERVINKEKRKKKKKKMTNENNGMDQVHTSWVAKTDHALQLTTKSDYFRKNKLQGDYLMSYFDVSKAKNYPLVLEKHCQSKKAI